MAEQKTPFGQGSAGANAFKAAYDRLKAEADANRTGITQNYSDAYQQLRGQQYTQGLGAAAQKGLSGGQAEGVRQQVSAQQMGALGNLMQGQERALREAKVGEGSIYSNALLEGQQSQEMENARLAQINALLTKADGKQKNINELSNIELQQLQSLGYQLPGSVTGSGTPNTPGMKVPPGFQQYPISDDVGVFGINANKTTNRYARGEIGYAEAFKLLQGETAFGGNRRYTDAQIFNRLRLATR
jgi:hypothetical protein